MSLQLDHVTNINQGFQDGRPAWTELTLQVMMTSSQLGYINYVCEHYLHSFKPYNN